MLNDSHEAGADTIVSWLSHGRGFKVHESETFVKQVMARYFKQTKYKSFQRQVNILLSEFSNSTLNVDRKIIHSILVFNVSSSFRRSSTCGVLKESPKAHTKDRIAMTTL
jgi:hypothetical protein